MKETIEPKTAEDSLTRYILNHALTTSSGVSNDQLVSFEKVLNIKSWKDQQQNHSGKTLQKIRVLLDDNTQADWFVLSLWYAGGDDADDWCNLFDSDSAAQSAYNQYT